MGPTLVGPTLVGRELWPALVQDINTMETRVREHVREQMTTQLEEDLRAVCGPSVWADRDFVLRVLATADGVAIFAHRADQQGREIVPSGYVEGENLLFVHRTSLGRVP